MRREFVGAILAGLILASSLASMLFLVNAERRRLDAVEAELLAVQQKKEELGRLQEIFNRTIADRATIDRYFVACRSLPDFIGQLEELASNSGLLLEIVDLESVATSGACLEDGFRIDFKTLGRFPQILQFISLVELLPTRLRFDQAVFVSNTSETWNGTFALFVFGNADDDAKK